MTDDLRKPGIYILAALVMAASGGGSYFRIDKWTETQAREMEQRLMTELQRSERRMLLKLCATLPPERTRQRIRALERAVGKSHPEHDLPPTQSWNDPCA